ncbi:unnamed protein product [Bursaphelenchus xylophilus]|uniref:(pine wood nematode) hypothetical protein n=1 Tax=Bursaphelenchus xylophilus TaxID=6326 RepID=A0A1I7RPR3_BURXY|nr:unnamed protein product [Bursaphelenchus xylophilus]CAG9096479.1 unnamed protein product [Bursaphelenchus xylophilus]
MLQKSAAGPIWKSGPRREWLINKVMCPEGRRPLLPPIFLLHLRSHTPIERLRRTQSDVREKRESRATSSGSLKPADNRVQHPSARRVSAQRIAAPYQSMRC